ncbi:DUF4157 domain-containing protein [Mucilaginibacter sp. cycad4]|uniref:eCIS core domain-containing protein n=1 Tax=Mucilaginibacter sp. cycad4 TaxID=3342096 RepID=UPI002AAAF29A|nr:DUF4157 domain-containing protein [Mucilaginibacter gossypii]WPV01758.1 DUF4157 domain-containing protein [Mucilaginibacter gossypii]
MHPDKSGQTPGNALPAQLKSGVEALSGLPMDDVRVSYNSPAPARVGALAYAKGNQIHIGPGEEQHLPHEAWHVVQQKQGRVKPTLQAKGLAINDNPALEAEADMMGQRAAQLKTAGDLHVTPLYNPVSQYAGVVQRKIGLEFQAVNSIFLGNITENKERLGGIKGEFNVEGDDFADGNKPLDLEIVTEAVDENPAGREQLMKTMVNIVKFLSQIEDNLPLEKIKGLDWEEKISERFEANVTIKFAAEMAENERTKPAEKEIVDPTPPDVDADFDFDVVFGKYEELKDQADKSRKEKEQVEAEREKKRVELPQKYKEDLLEIPKFIVDKSGKMFSPQATVGVKFENVVDLIEHLTSAPLKTGGIEEASSATETKDEEKKISEPQKHANLIGWGGGPVRKPFKLTSRQGLEQAKSNMGITSTKVRGIAAIAYGLAKNHENPDINVIGDPMPTRDTKDPKDIKSTEAPKSAKRQQAYIKDMMPFMLRTGLWPFINNLNPSEILELKQLLIDDTLNLKVTPIPNKDDIAPDNVPTVKAILLDLIKKKETPEHRQDEEDKEEQKDVSDLLQDEEVAGYGEIRIGETMKKKYKMKSLDDIGPSQAGPGSPVEKIRQGAIIELRKLGSRMPIGGLINYALAVFDLIHAIHHPGLSSEPSPAVSSSASVSSSSL